MRNSLDWKNQRIQEMEQKSCNSGFEFVVIDNNPDDPNSFPYCAYMEDAYYKSLSDRLLNLICV